MTYACNKRVDKFFPHCQFRLALHAFVGTSSEELCVLGLACRESPHVIRSNNFVKGMIDRVQIVTGVDLLTLLSIMLRGHCCSTRIGYRIMLGLEYHMLGQ